MPNSEQYFSITEANQGQRIDAVLSELTTYSRARVQQLLKDGHILLNHQSVKPSYRLQGGESIHIRCVATTPLSLEAEAIALDILYEDEELLIVNKPAGMVVHPSHGHDSGTLVHALLHHCRHLPGINGVERPGIVHRLDKDTSGSLVVAKTERAHRGLSDLFSRHDIRREYLAWCRGVPAWVEHHMQSMIGRHPNHRQKMAILPEQSERGRLAITDARRELSVLGLFSRLRLSLHTGRTHQIRVHLSAEQLPILADDVYARRFHPSGKLPTCLREAIVALQRQALHAEVIGFHHPVSGQWIERQAPLPDDLQQLDQAMRSCS